MHKKNYMHEKITNSLIDKSDGFSAMLIRN